MKINKKQIVMLTLSLIVCVAVYLNWRFLQGQQYNNLTDTSTTSNVTNTTETSGDAAENKEEENNENSENKKTLGEAQYVSSAGTSVEEYFTSSRLTRQQSKDEALELLQAVVSNEASSAESVEKANAEIVAIAEDTELEGTIENLIKAKGFKDCVVFISSDVVNVVVNSDGLTAEQAAQINELVSSHTKMPASKIKIVEVK